MSRDEMSVLQVDTADTGGGAERVMTGLHAEYLRLGLDSWMAVGFKRSEDSRVLEIPNTQRRSRWSRGLSGASARMAARGGAIRMALARAELFASDPARYRNVLAGIEDFDFPATADVLTLPPRRPDVLHLHNLHGGYFDIRALPLLSRRAPTVLTLHDAWLLGGHCVHPFECEGWRSGCLECPSLGIPVPIRADGSSVSWRIKRDAVRASRIAVAAPSEWLMGRVRASEIFVGQTDLRVIPNGVDATVFRPGEKVGARAALGLPQDRDIVLFAAQFAASNPFKDFTTLLESLPLIERNRKGVQLVALGEAQASCPPSVLCMPFEPDPAKVARYYQAADVYVHPARAENLPLAPIEAMACGTPVVASRVGGIPEIVVDDVTGILVPVGDAAALAAGVVELLGDVARRMAFSDAGQARVQERFTIERQADAYVAWYEELAAAAG